MCVDVLDDSTEGMKVDPFISRGSKEISTQAEREEGYSSRLASPGGLTWSAMAANTA